MSIARPDCAEHLTKRQNASSTFDRIGWSGSVKLGDGLVVDEDYIHVDGIAGDVQFVGGKIRVRIAHCQATQDGELRRDGQL